MSPEAARQSKLARRRQRWSYSVAGYVTKEGREARWCGRREVACVAWQVERGAEASRHRHGGRRWRRRRGSRGPTTLSRCMKFQYSVERQRRHCPGGEVVSRRAMEEENETAPSAHAAAARLVLSTVRLSNLRIYMLSHAGLPAKQRSVLVNMSPSEHQCRGGSL